MRVIAGSAKGTRLAPVPSGVRPVSDMAREGIFSSLGDLVPGARVLDLYAGTGAMAIEALSRGSDGAVLVEQDRAALRAIRANLGLTRTSDGARLVPADVAAFLSRQDQQAAPFDLVFVDPPYAVAAPELERVLARLAKGWLREGGWRVVLTRPTGTSTPVIPLDWAVTRRLTYGDTLVLIIRQAIRGE